jgi:ATP-dependent protease HslVU (ClpYQ) peptidase subunit
LVGGALAVKAPQRLLRNALAVVLIASGTTLIVNEGTPEVVGPAIAVATVTVGALYAAQALSRRRHAAPQANIAGGT